MVFNLTCGITVRRVLRLCSPSSPIGIPSIVMQPLVDSIIRAKARASDDFPAPVLPTTPTYMEIQKKLKSWPLDNFL